MLQMSQRGLCPGFGSLREQASCRVHLWSQCLGQRPSVYHPHSRHLPTPAAYQALMHENLPFSEKVAGGWTAGVGVDATALVWGDQPVE